MSRRHRPLVLLLDEGTPVPAARPFQKRSHSVIFHYEVLENGATDEQVVAAAILNEAVLIAVDADMRRMARRFGTPAQRAILEAELDLLTLQRSHGGQAT